MSEPHTLEAGASDPATIHHEFKSHPSAFWPAARGEKLFEYRRDDRGGYEVGQMVRLRCFHPERGHLPFPPVDRRITNILRGGEFELPEGYCILGFAALASSAGPVPDEVRRLLVEARSGLAAYVGEYAHLGGSTEPCSSTIAEIDTLLAAPSGRPDTPPAGGGAVDEARLDEINRAIVAALGTVDIEGEAAEYELCGDEGYYTPTEDERGLLVDFAHGLMLLVHEAVRPLVLAAPEPAAGGGREIAATQVTLGEGPFRVGRKVPRHVYEGDEPLFTAASDEAAARYAGLLNAGLHKPTPAGGK